ncbi:MAG: phosphatidylserine decarboxylase [Elusimicrobiota bacterium]|jgi:phosphatidylserine decarboxylase
MSFPKEYIYDENDLPPGSGWDIPAILRELAQGRMPSDFAKFFDRDPERRPPEREDVVVSPADGILELKPAPNAPARFVIHLRVTDVHVQRVPLAGTVREVLREGSGHFYPDDERYWGGVQAVTTVESRLGIYIVRQLTTLVTRRIENYLQPGSAVRTGDRLGRIRLGSTVTLDLPGRWKPVARTGQKVVAGETLLAEFLP